MRCFIVLIPFGDYLHRRTITTFTTFFFDQLGTRNCTGGFKQLVTAKTSSCALLQTEVSILRIYDGNICPTGSRRRRAVFYDFAAMAATEGKTTTRRLVSSPPLYERFSALRNGGKRILDYNGSQRRNDERCCSNNGAASWAAKTTLTMLQRQQSATTTHNAAAAATNGEITKRHCFGSNQRRNQLQRHGH